MINEIDNIYDGVKALVAKGKSLIKIENSSDLLNKLLYLMTVNVEIKDQISKDNLNIDLIHRAIQPLSKLKKCNETEILEDSALNISSCKKAFTKILKVEKKRYKIKLII